MVVPYDARNDPESDKFLPWMWKRMQDDDLVDYYFPGQKDTGFATFVRLFSGDGQVAIFINKDASGNEWAKRVVGFITWTTMTFGATECIVAGFIFFREWWDHHTTDECAKQAFHSWFTQTPASIVLGVCPELHKTALRYNKRIGLHEIGRIPDGHLFKGQPCDALLMAMTRKEYEGRH
jgi:RimJ/RimL family protein N-acetyltransferase